LTASQDLTVTCANFMLDAVDDFIDECNGDITSTDFWPELPLGLHERLD
jgi:hypothetical protein